MRPAWHVSSPGCCAQSSLSLRSDPFGMPPSLVLARLAVGPRATARLPTVRLDHFFGDSLNRLFGRSKLHSRTHAVRDQPDAGQLKPSCFLGFLRARQTATFLGASYLAELVQFFMRDHVEEEGRLARLAGSSGKRSPRVVHGTFLLTRLMPL